MLLDAKPEPVEIDLAKSAIVVVDMQNAFASKSGMLDIAGVDISGAPAVVRRIAGLLETARRAECSWSIFKWDSSRISATAEARQRPTGTRNWPFV